MSDLSLPPVTRHESILAVTLFAAYSDGDRCDEERARVDLIAAEFGGEDHTTRQNPAS